LLSIGGRAGNRQLLPVAIRSWHMLPALIAADAGVNVGKRASPAAQSNGVGAFILAARFVANETATITDWSTKHHL
jgi:hypothetical protein